jgi:hypothetical protein
MNYHSFALENLESRALLSAAAPLGASPMMNMSALYAAARTTSTHSPFTAPFNVPGTFTKALGNPDAGSQDQFIGAGKTKSLGKFTLTGHIQTPGFVAHGKAAGQLVLTTAKGTITLSVSGPAASGSLPTMLNFTITKGTGAYAKSTGKGSVSVSASNTTHKFLFTLHPGK